MTHLAAGVAAGLFVTSQASAGVPSWVKPGDKYVKCAGVSAVAQNDCGAKGVYKGKTVKHTCHGKAPASNLDFEWIYTPEEVCKKLTGAQIIATKTAPKKK